MPRASAQTIRACVFMRVQLRLHSLYSSTFVVSKPRWPRRAVIPDLHLHRQFYLVHMELILPRLSLIPAGRETNPPWPMPVVLCDDIPPPGLYHIWYVTTFRVTFLSMTHHGGMTTLLSPVEFSSELTGLSPRVIYYFQLAGGGFSMPARSPWMASTKNWVLTST